jgi:hypothetical protein
MTVAAAREADGLVAEAHRRGYRFPPEFAGFSAGVVWQTDDESGTGTLTARLGDEGAVELDGVEGWVEQQLRSLLSHRAHRSYEAGDGAFAKQVDGDGPLGTRVRIEDSMDSSYVVGDGGIALVTRAHGGTRFTIAVQQKSPTPDGRELPTAFTVAYWDGAGALVASEAHSDAYADLAGVLVPAGRTIVRADGTGLSVRRIVLDRHAPLDGSRS